VIEHAAKYPAQSLGVVAFSTAQAQAIQAALEIERKASPATESFFNGKPEEPFFIKNLENVQGDERDVIMISIGYGRTEEGKVPMNFGPLNNEGGERRLNVLITRAKMRCEVFTNITSEDIKVNEFGTFRDPGTEKLPVFRAVC
jgi:superfamily I DNA and/or RNA helicase